jgi:hypothetical protein
MTTMGNIGITKKQTSIFMLVIEAINKHSKNIVDVMDRINTIQLYIDRNRTKF